MEICLNEYVKGCAQKMEMLVFMERQNGVMIKTLIFGSQHSRAGVPAPPFSSRDDPGQVI